MSDSAAVWPQHWLHADPREVATGSQELCAGSAPSTMLVCVICLDTDSRMSVLSELNLTEAYEKLIGDPLYDGGNLKQALCVQCAQTLRKFARFRDKSLRARSLMMELLEKHGSITTQHIKMLQCGHNQLKNNLVSTSLGPDHCDLLILEVDRQTDLEEAVHEVEIKNECNDDADSESADEVIKEDEDDAGCVSEGFNDGLIKYESVVFMCRVCYEEFHSEHAYDAHLSMHMHDDVQPSADSAHTMVTALSAGLATSTGNDEANSTPSSERALVSDGDASHTRALDSDSTVTSIRSCVVKLYDIFKCPPTADTKTEPSTRTLRDVSSCDSLNAHTACEDAQHRAASVGEVAVTRSEPAASTAPSETESCASGNTPRARAFTCDVCQRAFTTKGHLVTHMECHTGEKSYSCKQCSYKCVHSKDLLKHMRIHTGEKPFSCELCSYKCAMKNSLVYHMRTHTGEKPYYCNMCSYKCARKSSLVNHMSTHTGEKPYSCNLCSYKSVRNGHLLRHMRIHTGEKPSASTAPSETESCTSGNTPRARAFTCDVCQRAFTFKASLVQHMRIHTGEKPYSCKLCSSKFAQKSVLINHMRTHTGERPYSCKICSYKCAQRSSLLFHIMRWHTVEKPYSCEMCSYKCVTNDSLLTHMRKHTGEKPYSCEMCSYKCAQRSSLINHMRTHTGEKPYSCNMCSYKYAYKISLVYHMRTHTGEKPYSCKLCSYKSVRKHHLLRHMRIHTGEKPSASTAPSQTESGNTPRTRLFTCDICVRAVTTKENLVQHMRIHSGEKALFL